MPDQICKPQEVQKQVYIQNVWNSGFSYAIKSIIKCRLLAEMKRRRINTLSCAGRREVWKVLRLFVLLSDGLWQTFRTLKLGRSKQESLNQNMGFLNSWELIQGECFLII